MSIAVDDNDAPDMREYLLARRPVHTDPAISDIPSVTMKEARKDLQTHEVDSANDPAGEPVKADDEDDELERIRKARIAQLKKESEWRSRGHGEYTEVTEPEFLPQVTSSNLVVCHFYHRSFEKCKVIDKHLSEVIPTLMSVKFLKVDAEKAMFFVGKLGVRVLPTLVFFRDGVAIDRLVGFEGLGGTADDFPTANLRAKIFTVFSQQRDG